jgi:hypothetical protein
MAKNMASRSKALATKAAPTKTGAEANPAPAVEDAVADATPTAKPARKAKAAKPKKLSAIDAAAQVLVSKGEPMTAPELIEAMAQQGLWSSPKGKTPAATLYASMLREITTKGKESRFSRPGRGKFASTAKA